LKDELFTWKACCVFYDGKWNVLVLWSEPYVQFYLCGEFECYMYEKAITAWRCREQPHPRCHKHGKLARMCVVKDLMKGSYGRPFFVCGEKTKPCPFWMWGDVQPIAKPECHHGLPCLIRKVLKEALNKDRLFFCCPNDKESTCRFFDIRLV
jgi:hypothetical protein